MVVRVRAQFRVRADLMNRCAACHAAFRVQ
jgi:hypothetical protein